VVNVIARMFDGGIPSLRSVSTLPTIVEVFGSCQLQGD